MSLISYPLGGPIPWAPITASVALTVAFLSLAVLVVRRKEY